MDQNESFRQAIADKAILYKIDAEKGEGIALAKSYRVSAYPTFLLVNAEGETYDRWLGYGDPDSFTSTLDTAAADPITITARQRRFGKEPNADDAHKIGEINQYSGYYGEALAWYRRCAELDPARNVDGALMEVLGRGFRAGLFTAQAVKAQAEVVLTSSRSSNEEVLNTVSMLNYGTRDMEDRGLYLDALKLAARRLAAAEDESGRRGYATVMTDHALLIDGDEQAAYDWRLKSMPEGWREDAGALNGIAWWCFENRVALDAAEEYARKGVELAESEADKANILDTLAEICNEKGDCGEALDLIKAALKLNPESDYLQKQLVRFEKLFAEQQQG